MTNTVTGLKIPLSSIVTKEFYTIPSKYATTDKETQQTGFMVEGTDKNGNNTSAFVAADIYAQIEVESTEQRRKRTGFIYYVDKKKFKEGDVVVCQEDQSRYVIKDVGVLEGVYCTNQGYAVFRRIEVLDQNEEYAIVSQNTSYGLSRYDHIVRNADKVNEEEILY